MVWSKEREDVRGAMSQSLGRQQSRGSIGGRGRPRGCRAPSVERASEVHVGRAALAMPREAGRDRRGHAALAVGRRLVALLARDCAHERQPKAQATVASRDARTTQRPASQPTPNAPAMSVQSLPQLPQWPSSYCVSARRIRPSGRAGAPTHRHTRSRRRTCRPSDSSSGQTGCTVRQPSRRANPLSYHSEGDRGV